VMYLQAAYQYQEEHPKATLKEALAEVGRIIPEYRIPTRMLDQRWLSKGMSNPLITWFGAYHYGLLRSFTEAGKDAIGLGGGGAKPPKPPAGEPKAAEPEPEGRSKAETIRKGWDRLALLGIITMVLYPFVFDPLARKLTGDKHARFRRPGPAGYVDAATQVAEGKMTPNAALQKVVTPSPLTKGAAELALNREFFSGHAIYDPHADWGTEREQIVRYLMGEFGQYGQYERAGTAEQKQHLMWQQAQVQFTKTAAEKLAGDIAAAKVGTEAESPEDQANRTERRNALEELRKGDSQPLSKALNAGTINRKQAMEIRKRARYTELQDRVHGFSFADLLRVYAVADEDEKKELAPIVREKRFRSPAMANPILAEHQMEMVQ